MKKESKISIRLSSDEESELQNYLSENKTKASEFVRFAIRATMKGNYCTKTEILQSFHRILCALDNGRKEEARRIVSKEIQIWMQK